MEENKAESPERTAADFSSRKFAPDFDTHQSQTLAPVHFRLAEGIGQSIQENVVEDLIHSVLIRIAQNLGDRVGGPLTLRLLLQPTVATVLAVRAGLEDSKLAKPPYFWTLVSDRSHRSEMLKDGWKSVGKVFLFAVVLDVIYQIIVLHFVYPGEALIVAFVLAIMPYLIFRGLVTRIASSR